jgi:maltose alpha-D-glucosyltransferase/alpha-amylase
MVFPGVQESTWTRDEKAGAWYFHRFYDHQPDLNMDNPEVRTEIRRIIGFWLQLGVDGFRVDAVPFIIETPQRGKARNKPELHFEYLEEMRTFLQWRSGDAIFLGEANVTPKETADYFRNGRGIQMMFNFWVNQHAFYALASGDARPLEKALRETRDVPPTCQWAQFLRNHDELDLGRLSEERRQEVFNRFGPDPSMQLYDRGIRRRLAPMIGNRAQIELAYSLMFSLPGTPVIRYGDEIGMGENLRLNERDAVRTPMQWSARPGAGFSTATRLVHPLVDDGVYGCEEINVEAQRRDPDSLFAWMSRMIRLRKECPEVGWGTFEILRCGSPNVLALLFEWRGNHLLTLHNFDEHPHDVTVRLDVDGGDRLANLLEKVDLRADADGTHRLAIGAHGYRWFRVGRLDRALSMESERPLEAPAEPAGKRSAVRKDRGRSVARKGNRR